MTQGVKTHFFTDASTDKTIEAKYVTDGTAKAWANFTGTGTVTINESLNISSLVDNGTGDYSCNFSTSMSTADYGFNFGTASEAAIGANFTSILPSQLPTVNAIRVQQYAFNGAVVDSTRISVTTHGDLA